jgi:hypothetical protein
VKIALVWIAFWVVYGVAGMIIAWRNECF